MTSFSLQEDVLRWHSLLGSAHWPRYWKRTRNLYGHGFQLMRRTSIYCRYRRTHHRSRHRLSIPRKAPALRAKVWPEDLLKIPVVTGSRRMLYIAYIESLYIYKMIREKMTLCLKLSNTLFIYNVSPNRASSGIMVSVFYVIS